MLHFVFERAVFFLLQILLFLLLGFSANGQATTLAVPAGYATIAAAITASANGDTILVSAGTYSENINYGAKNITIQSISGAASTVIQGTGANNQVVTFNNAALDNTAVLDGFTIDNQATGNVSRGIYIASGAAPTIQNCIISGNLAVTDTATDGGGIYITGPTATSAKLINSTVSNNSGRSGVGIYVVGGAALDISGNTIINNNITNTTTGDGGGIQVNGAGSTLTMTGGSVTNNAGRYGSGIYVTNGAVTTISGATINSNACTCGTNDGGGFNVNGGTLTVDRSEIRGNSGRNGGGLYVWGSGTATIKNSNITGNVATTDGGGAFSGATVNIYNSTVAGNYASRGGGVRNNGSILNITNGIVYGNTATTDAGISAFGTTNITYSSYQAITAGQCTTCTNNRAVGENPLLVNLEQAGAGAPTTAGNLHLQSGSPVIDQGTNNGYTPDIDGDSRPQGAAYDMGSDEYVGAAVITTLATGTDPGAALLAPGGAATMADAFSFQTGSGTDTITAVTVTLAAGASGGLSLVEITNDAGTTVYGSVTNPASDTLAITLTTNITVTTTSTQYKIRVTPKSHANMPAPPGSTYSVTAYISGWTCTNTHAGSDTGGTTVTIDNLSPGNVTAATATAGNTQVSLAWTNPADADLHSIVVLRRATSAVADVPVEGTTYVVGNTIGTASVACVLAAPTVTCTDTGLTNGTAYYYKIFAKDANGNYSAAGVAPTGSPATPFVAPSLTFLKTVAVTSDPVNSTTNPKYIPGAEALYTVRVTNSGAGTVDNNTLVITDPIPASTELFTGNLSGGAPFIFTNGTPTSGLSCAFIALNNLTDCMDFSNDSGTSWTYVPNGSFDPAVTNIRFSPSGAMNGTGGGSPNFDLSFRVRVK